MTSQADIRTEGTLIWAAPDPAVNRTIVQTAASEFRFAVRFCRYAELFELLRNERCNLLVIEFGFDSHPGMSLLKEVTQRLPRLTTLAASNDTSVTMIRAVLELGASDFLSLPLNSQDL